MKQLQISIYDLAVRLMEALLLFKTFFRVSGETGIPESVAFA